MRSALEAIGLFGNFARAALSATLLAPSRPAEIARHLYGILIGALPLGFVAGVALGVVVWLHLNGVVPANLAGKVPEYLALIVALEFAPLGAGLVVAGRTGASFAAELSTMRLTEQIDALESMGLSATRYLVGPRVLAAMIALPILTIYLGVFALGSSFLAEMVGGAMYPTQYQHALRTGLEQAPLVLATAKTIVFGALIAMASCWCGLSAPAGAEGVGIAATRGVVLSIMLVLASDVVLVRIVQLLSGNPV